MSCMICSVLRLGRERTRGYTPVITILIEPLYVMRCANFLFMVCYLFVSVCVFPLKQPILSQKVHSIVGNEEQENKDENTPLQEQEEEEGRVEDEGEPLVPRVPRDDSTDTLKRQYEEILNMIERCGLSLGLHVYYIKFSLLKGSKEREVQKIFQK